MNVAQYRELLKKKVPPRPRHTPGKMNKTEVRYAEYLERRKMAGEIIESRFEPFNLRLAPNTYYRPDFLVVTEKQIEVHKVKGFMEDDAAVKIKVAANIFWFFGFKLVKENGRNIWLITDV
jgi:hypothetical protein